LKRLPQLVGHEPFGEFRALSGDRLGGGVVEALLVGREALLPLDLVFDRLQVFLQRARRTARW